MKIPLSVLDLSPVVSGSTPSEALRNTLNLARLADKLGYTRYWLAEHHNSPSIASSAPEIMIGQIARETARIRVGSGGIMLPNHAPLKVAEWFRTLEALFPGRIDLGIGRAPGTDPRTALALRRSSDNLRAENFPAQLEELFHFTTGGFPPDHPFRTIIASPNDVPLPPVWLLGSSLFSAHLSAELGLGFAFAHHFSPHAAIEAMRIYHSQFSPSPYLAERHAILTVAVICAETDEEADYLASSQDLFWVRFQSGQFAPLPSPTEAANYPYTPAEQMLVRSRRSHIFVGSPASVQPRIQALVKHTGAHEVMVTTHLHDHQKRLRCYELLAEAFGLSP